MSSKLFIVLLFLTTSFYADAQTVGQKSVLQNPTTPAAKWEAENEKISPDISNKTRQSSNQTQQTYVRPTGKERFNRYVKSMFRPIALAKTVVKSGYSTWRNSPEEWGENWEGFGRRVASSFGKSAIKQTTIYALEEALKLDSKFYRSQKKDFGSRLRNALISPFTARKPDGKRVFGFPRIAGTYTSSIIAYETWYPKRYSYKNGLRGGTISLGFNAAFNVFKEFVWRK